MKTTVLEFLNKIIRYAFTVDVKKCLKHSTGAFLFICINRLLKFKQLNFSCIIYFFSYSNKIPALVIYKFSFCFEKFLLQTFTLIPSTLIYICTSLLTVLLLLLPQLNILGKRLQLIFLATCDLNFLKRRKISQSINILFKIK